MSKKNTLEFTTPYYAFKARDPKFRDVRFLPKIFVTRIDDKNVKIIVNVLYYTFGVKKVSNAGNVEYIEAVDNQEEYFRKLQNSNFSFGLPRPLVFLEKVITVIQKFVRSRNSAGSKKSSTPVSVNATSVPGFCYTEPLNPPDPYCVSNCYETICINCPSGNCPPPPPV